jgi:hypothetical protein
VPSGGFAAGPFSEGSLTIGSIGCPRPVRSKFRAPKSARSPPF